MNHLRPPTARGMKLKHLKDIEPFSKKLKIVLVMGFTVESMTAARPPYSLSFRHLEDINQCNWDIGKGI